MVESVQGLHMTLPERDAHYHRCGDDSMSIRVMFQWRSTIASSLILLDVSRAGRANVSVNLTPDEENDDTNAVLS